MSKSYHCQKCTSTHQYWLGRCPICNEWNTLMLKEDMPNAQSGGFGQNIKSSMPIPITKITDFGDIYRIQSNISELDNVCGGGLVPGSLVLFSGDPGVGKSTLLLQMLHAIANSTGRVLYTSGEESVAQIAMRANRLGTLCDNLILLAETNIERILEHTARIKPKVLAIDSIQTVYTEQLPSLPGSLLQVRECAAHLLAYAKRQNVPTILVGHITKDGTIAGPKSLEHIVDTVLEFRGEENTQYRILKAQKNRFGSTHAIGVFIMGEMGLTEVTDPSDRKRFFL